MKLCEELELNGIEVVSANTDGIVVKLYKRKIADFDRIVKEWETLTGFSADSEDYMYYINSDINNYLIKALLILICMLLTYKKDMICLL